MKVLEQRRIQHRIGARVGRVSCTGRWILYHWHHLGSPEYLLTEPPGKPQKQDINLQRCPLSIKRKGQRLIPRDNFRPNQPVNNKFY